MPLFSSVDMQDKDLSHLYEYTWILEEPFLKL